LNPDLDVGYLYEFVVKFFCILHLNVFLKRGSTF